MKVLLSAIRSPYVVFRGDYLNHIVKTCYNVYLGGLNGTNQICAKAVLAQIVLIVFARVEEDSMYVSNFMTVSVSELLEFTDRNLSEGNSAQLVQNVINEVMESNSGVEDIKQLTENAQNGNGNMEGKGNRNDGHDLVAKAEENVETEVKVVEDSKADMKTEEKSDGLEVSGGRESMLREDGFMLFKNLCKLSMKFSSQEHSDDEILLRGKILSLELLKVIMDNSGSVWRSNESFLNIIKQFLCLSLLKNSALSVMTIFQLLCSIFMSLLSKFRSGLKAEIGIFFPMLILRVLENILQPRFIQKMTVLNLLEKISQDPQLIIDLFVNYDCDLDAPNIYERTVNGLLKTALGPPAGSTTLLSPVKDLTFRVESVKCLVRIVKSMGAWMDQQLKIGESSLSNKSSVVSGSVDIHSALNGEEGMIAEYELHSESNSESSDAATLEQRRAYKLEIQKGISLFNRKPSKGVEFLINTKKVGGSPEDVASFLKNTAGLNPTVIGDYLGEREDFPLKVMHAYVDAFNFEKMDLGEAIRYFLRGFRLPGEAQKIDRIMEKFAERYCKCNPNSFKSADTAYVLAYSVIMLNTDAHNSMVKDKMTKADFIRNNRGIDDGKDLPEEYLGALYDQIVKNEIKMNAENSQPRSKQVNGLNRLLGLDGILNLVMGKQPEEKPLGTNGLLIKNIQEQFKAKSGKSESVFYAVSDVSILRFMVEVCWGPMLAAFSMTLDQSDDKLATSECLQGFRYAVHVTAVLSMQTQRDAFVTSLAKFTYLHCAADMKQKNVDAMKTIMSIAIENGNYLQEAWEHILTCLSRFEHLQLLGEGVPPDASFLSMSNAEPEQKSLKSSDLNSLKKKGALQNPAVAAVVRGGSYDSSTLANSPKLVTSEQVTNFISNLHLLDQIGSYELNHIFAHSQRLNSEAIVSFVRALCKVSMSELQSPTDPRVFSLTKIVEIAHYNMNRIRLVWSRIWNELSDFFVSVGLSENLSVAIFVMDSLRQLAMKFLEREELANYNFQNEFLRPFVIVMQKSNSAEIRELIVRCISQMVLSRVSNVKSGWKSVFMVFTTAAADERKSIVLLAFETMEKIVREYFPHITETESTTFTDCVRCLITFTNSKYDSDVSFNAIAFLRFCALKLAEGGLFCNEDSQDTNSYDLSGSVDASDRQAFTSKDENISFWMPLLTGLSRLTSDPRSAIRKSSVEVLFNILMDHGSLFSRPFWNAIFKFVLFPILSYRDDKDENEVKNDQSPPAFKDSSSHGSSWDSETSSVAAERLVDLFVTFFTVVKSQLPNAVTVLADFIKSPGPGPGPAKTGIAALVRLTSELGTRLSEDDWRGMLMAIKDAAASTIPGFLRVIRTMDNIDIPDATQSYHGLDMSSDNELSNNDLEDDNLQTATYVISRMKSHIAVQLVIIQLVTDLYKTHHDGLSAANLKILLELFSLISSHANQLSSEVIILRKLQTVCNMLELSDPPVVHFENESYQSYLDFLNDLLLERRSSNSEDIDLEAQVVEVCEKILLMYVECAGTRSNNQKPADEPVAHWILPLLSAKKEELAARSTLLLSALRTLNRLEKDSFRRYISRLFPLLVDLVRSEHSSREVLPVLSDMFQTCIGPIIVES